MSTDYWFPLAIYHVDLPDYAQVNAVMCERIKTLFDKSQPRHTIERASWTGDVHGVDQLHLDPAFDWLTAQVAAHAQNYLTSQGYDINKFDVYVQRAWPVIAASGQRIDRHAHHSAHLTAVYYLVAGTDKDAGEIVFFNDHRPNEFCVGLANTQAQGGADQSAANLVQPRYKPVIGRLLLFPAKQSHAVLPNQRDDERISISYDLVLTARDDVQQGASEYMMPPPKYWRRITARSGALDQMDNGPERLPLRIVARSPDEIDEFSIPAMNDHVLSKPWHVSHVSSPAIWYEDRQALAGQPAAAPLEPAETRILHWRDDGAPRVLKDAANIIYRYLENQGVPLSGATLTAPMLTQRVADSLPSFSRGRAHLSVYIHLDDGNGDCRIEFCELEAIRLVPGSMLVVGRARRHRLLGPGTVLQFGLDLPALARTDAAWSDDEGDHEMSDDLAFAALTAAPLNHPRPPIAKLSEKISRLAGRAFSRSRRDECPVHRRYIIANADPASATDADLAQVLAYRGSGDLPAGDGRWRVRPSVLSAGQCNLLRGFADRRITSAVLDTVDGHPEYQVNLDLAQLKSLVGDKTVMALLELPQTLDPPEEGGAPDILPHVEIFLRLYSPVTRPFIGFHTDLSDYTINVALSDDVDVSGGRLLMLSDDGLQALSRTAGSAVVHAGQVVHGVTRISQGTRHSLIIFLSKRRL